VTPAELVIDVSSLRFVVLNGHKSTVNEAKPLVVAAIQTYGEKFLRLGENFHWKN